jgi:hypothetical protein
MDVIKEKRLIPQELIENKIYLIRGLKVMLDRDLAKLYGVAVKVLNQAVQRNHKRFPPDFAFKLNFKELSDLKSQFVTSSWGGIRKMPSAFSENGVAMLSSVLNSERAIQVNIQIMRTFTKLREMMMTHVELKRKIEEMEKKYDRQFTVVFEAIKKLLEPPPKPKRRIGFVLEK